MAEHAVALKASLVPRAVEALAAAAFFAVAVAGGVVGATYPGESRMFPWIVSGILGLASLVWFVEVARKPFNRTEAASSGQRPLLPLIIGLGATIAYTLAVISFGYFIPTVIFIPAMAALLGNKNWMLSTGITLAYVILIYFLFVMIFERPIPLW